MQTAYPWTVDFWRGFSYGLLLLLLLFMITSTQQMDAQSKYVVLWCSVCLNKFHFIHCIDIRLVIIIHRNQNQTQPSKDHSSFSEIEHMQRNNSIYDQWPIYFHFIHQQDAKNTLNMRALMLVVCSTFLISLNVAHFHFIPTQRS